MLVRVWRIPLGGGPPSPQLADLGSIPISRLLLTEGSARKISAKR